MSNLKNELDATRYGDLKAKFEELGIAEAWKSGVKKDALVELAVNLIEKRDALKNEVSNDDELVEAEQKVSPNELESQLDENLESPTEVSELQKDVDNDKNEARNLKIQAFNKEVEKITSKEGVWTKETLEKRIQILGKVFVQHRNSPKGKESLVKQEILIKALEVMF
jgi:hypothetical protein